MADVIQLRSTTFVEGHAWWPTYATGLRNSTIYLGRNRWTAGDPILEAVDCEAGAQFVHSVDRRLRLFRQAGMGTADDTARLALASTIGAIAHPADYGGSLPSIPIAAHGDLGIGDFGTDDRFLWACDSVVGWYTLSVRAQYRTAATEPDRMQHSDRIVARASSWSTGDSAAHTREWAFQSRIASEVDVDDEWHGTFAYRRDTDAWTTAFTLSPSGGWVSSDAGAGNLFLYSTQVGASAGARAAWFGPTGLYADGVEVRFGHTNSTRHAVHRFYGVDDETTGVGARAIELTYNAAATGGATMRNGPSGTHACSYWDGAAAQTVRFYTQHQLDSTGPTGRWRLGSDYGDGTFDFDQAGNLTLSGEPATGGGDFHDSPIMTLMGSYYDGGPTPSAFRFTGIMDTPDPAGHLRISTSFDSGTFDHYGDGSLWIRGTSASNLYLDLFDAASMGTPTRGSMALVMAGKSWDGAASQDRLMAWYVAVDAAADSGDLWSARLTSGGPDLVIVNQAGAQSLAGSIALSGDSAFGGAASLSLAPSYSGAHTLDVHAYQQILNPALTGTTLTDAVLVTFDAAAGTHKAVDSGTTKTSPGNVTAWLKYQVDGVIFYSPLYTSKTA